MNFITMVILNYILKISTGKDVQTLYPPVFKMTGLNFFHTMVSKMLVAVTRQIPEPRPYPFMRHSPKSSTIRQPYTAGYW
jgi:hypothetical protein